MPKVKENRRLNKVTSKHSKLHQVDVKLQPNDDDHCHREINESSPSSIASCTTTKSIGFDKTLSKLKMNLKHSFKSKKNLIGVYVKECSKECDQLNEKLSENIKTHAKMNEEFTSSMGLILQQWQEDITKVQDMESKINEIIAQQKAYIENIDVSQNHRCKALKQVYEQFSKNASSIEAEGVNLSMTITQDIVSRLDHLEKSLLSDLSNSGQKSKSLKKYKLTR